MPRKVLLEFRRDTAANWTSTNPVLAAGEPGYETDTGKAKIGDGATAWNALAYFAPAGSGVTTLNGLAGALSIVAGSNISVTPAGSNITIAYTGGGIGVTTYRTTTTTKVVNTVAETDLLAGAITIAAGVMGTTGMLRLTTFGDLINNNATVAAIPRFKLKLGGTTIIDTNTPGGNWFAQASRYPWRVQAEIMNLGSASSQWCNFNLILAGSIATGFANFTTGNGNYAAGYVNNTVFATGTNSSAVNTALAQALVLSVILPAASNNLDVTLKSALIEVI